MSEIGSGLGAFAIGGVGHYEEEDPMKEACNKVMIVRLSRELPASALVALGIHLHHSVMGVCLGGLAWAITQVLAADHL